MTGAVVFTSEAEILEHPSASLSTCERKPGSTFRILDTQPHRYPSFHTSVKAATWTRRGT